MRVTFGFIFLIAGLFCAYCAFDTVRWQHRAITAFTPTPAWIDNVDVTRHTGSKGRVYYTPEVSYHYTVNGTVHNSQRVLPISDDGDSSWANDVVAPFRDKWHPVELPGDKPPSLAYVNPDNPDDAILVRQYSFLPYMLTLLSLLGAAVGVGMLAGFFRAPRSEMAAIALDASDARLLLPTVNLRSQFKNALGLLITLSIVMLLPLFHWYFVARPPFGTFGSWVATAIAATVLIAMLILTLRRWSVSRHLSDARLRIRPAPMVRGQPLDLELEADAYSHLRVQEASCKLVCVEHYQERRGNKTYVGTRTHREQKVTFTGPTEIPADQVIAGKGVVTFPGDCPPTSALANQKKYPYYTWEARVNIELTGMIDYAGVFPIDVV